MISRISKMIKDALATSWDLLRPCATPACFGTGQDLAILGLQRGEVVVVVYATTEAVHENSGSTGLEHLERREGYWKMWGTEGKLVRVSECVDAWVVLWNKRLMWHHFWKAVTTDVHRLSLYFHRLPEKQWYIRYGLIRYDTLEIAVPTPHVCSWGGKNTPATPFLGKGSVNHVTYICLRSGLYQANIWKCKFGRSHMLAPLFTHIHAVSQSILQHVCWFRPYSHTRHVCVNLILRRHQVNYHCNCRR